MIGDKIRQLRFKKGLSLTEFARRTGMSKSMISQIEHGNTNPSIETTRQIASVLGVPVFTFFLQDGQAENMVVRRDKRIRISIPDSSEIRELLTPDLNRNMVLLHASLGPGQSSSPTFTSHIGEECLYVLKGTLTIHRPNEEIVLEEGDSIYYSALEPHYLSNSGQGVAEFISAISPPTIQS